MPPKNSIKSSQNTSTGVVQQQVGKIEMCETKGEGKTIEETYTKYTDREHVLYRPDSYVGSIGLKHEYMFVYDDNSGRIIRKMIDYVPGLYKIFDEILVNARDQSELDKTCDTVSVNIDRDTNTISVINNGKGIDVVMHKEHGKYVPELLFGELRTSSNYNDTEQKTTGGRNGFGAKLTNIFSKKFIVDTLDSKRKKRFYQEYYNNMETRTDAVIQDVPNTPGYTRITFTFDHEAFGLPGLTDDIYALFKKRVYDLAGVTNKCKVFFNDEQIVCKDFKAYCGLYWFEGMDTEEADDDAVAPSENSVATVSSDKPFELFYEKANERWSVGFMYAPDFGYTQISFVNGICTYHGGSHVEYVVNFVLDKLKDGVLKTHKDLKFGRKQLQDMKDNMIVFVNCTISNPAFTSQVKDVLSSEVKDFGSVCNVKDTTLNKFAKAGIMSQISDMIKLKEQLVLKKTDGKKSKRIKNLAKLEDANKAGGDKSANCVLIITEGDSAKTLAMSGRGSENCDYIGIFPIRGKLMNVRDASTKSLLENEEITNIKKIMGLEHGKEYTDVSGLRYGKIVIMSDQDVDGFHIKGLLINFIHNFWPSLLKIRGFVTCLPTPVVKATKGTEVKEFYNLIEVDKFKETATGNWSYKYYKGLGTSNDEDAKEYFENFYEKLVEYVDDSNVVEEDDVETINNDNKTDDLSDENDDQEYVINAVTTGLNSTAIDIHFKPKYKNPSTEAITLGFEKKRANHRKIWLKHSDGKTYLDNTQKLVTIPEFIHKELILFSREDVERSLPSICDGLKPSTRKVLYSAFLKNLNGKSKEIKVSQFAGYVAEKSEYHHGETSLFGAIVGMAQNYVGSNNINLLHPSGQFGSRVLGGKDSAAPRYILTYLEELTRLIFNPIDDNILNYLVEDGATIEPEYYLPIIPMALVNGSVGIGTGYACNIPCFNPLDIIANVRAAINDEDLTPMKPWYNNFKGTILPDSNTPGKYNTFGVITQLDTKHIKITELPIGMWSTKYRGILDKLETPKKGKDGKVIAGSALVKSYDVFNTKISVNIIVELDPTDLANMLTDGSIYKKLKLVTSVNTRNMYAFSPEGKIEHYHNTDEVIDAFYDARYKGYVDRKNFMIGKLTKEKDILWYKILFIKSIVEGNLVLNKKKKAVVIAELEKMKFVKFVHPESDTTESFNYLLSMDILSLTEEKIAELQKKFDDKNAELEKVIATEESDMWLEDLDNLEQTYLKWIEKTRPKETKSNTGAQKETKTRKPRAKAAPKRSAKALEMTDI